MNHERALELLEGLAEPDRVAALAHAREVLSWDSSARQGRVKRVFGLHPDADRNLRELWVGLGSRLRQELYSQLALYQQTLFPDFAPSLPAERRPFERLLARRQLLEATR